MCNEVIDHKDHNISNICPECLQASDCEKCRCHSQYFRPYVNFNKPAKAYKKPKNNYFARREEELGYKYGSANHDLWFTEH